MQPWALMGTASRAPLPTGTCHRGFPPMIIAYQLGVLFIRWHHRFDFRVSGGLQHLRNFSSTSHSEMLRRPALDSMPPRLIAPCSAALVLPNRTLRGSGGNKDFDEHTLSNTEDCSGTEEPWHQESASNPSRARIRPCCSTKLVVSEI